MKNEEKKLNERKKQIEYAFDVMELFERNGGFNRKRLDKDCALCYNNAILT
jgi:hypothetical protein